MLIKEDFSSFKLRLEMYIERHFKANIDKGTIFEPINLDYDETIQHACFAIIDLIEEKKNDLDQFADSFK